KANLMTQEQLKDPLGGRLSLEGLARLEKDFNADRLARAFTSQRIQQLIWPVAGQANTHRAQWLKDGKWTGPASVIEDAIKAHGMAANTAHDAWGRPIKLVKRDKKLSNPTGHDLYNTHELVSAGPDGKFDTDDDVRQSVAIVWRHGGWWGDQTLQLAEGGRGGWGMDRRNRQLGLERLGADAQQA